MGRIGEFNVAPPQTWDVYADQIKYYLEANDIEDEGKKRATLLAVCGVETLSIVKTLVFPNSPSGKSYEELIVLLRQHFIPKPSEIYQRFHFQRRVQQNDERISAYATELRHLSENCNFAATLNDRLRDQLVCGMRDEELQRRLLARTDLTFDIVLKEALAAEAAAGQSKDIQAGSASSATAFNTHQLRGKKYKQTRDRFSRASEAEQSRSEKACAGCGGEHSRSYCRFKDTICYFCSKRGHIERACWKKENTQTHFEGKQRVKKNEKMTASANVVHGESSDEDFLGVYDENSVHSLDVGSRHKEQTTVLLQGKPCKMEVDSGSDFSIISAQTFRKLWPNGGPKLTPVTRRLVDFQRRPVEMKGECKVDVKYGPFENKLHLLIAEGDRVSLLGLDWFKPLGISLTGIHYIKSDPIKDVVSEFSDVFSEGLGSYNGPSVSLNLDPIVSPIQMKPRRVPLALLPKIEEELDRLINEGVLEPTSDAKWATPIVPVLKSDGGIRLCADYKCTINKALRQHPHPIPAVNRILANQSGGEFYAKIDLAKAYLQLQVDDESAAAQTIITHRGAYRVKRLQFGVSSAPGIFQSLIEKILQGIPGAAPYFDDVIVKGRTREELASRLREVLLRLRATGLRANIKKCIFGVTNIEFLGYRLDATAIRPTEAKVKAIHGAPPPKDSKELQAFLGLLNFYHSFLKGKATIAEPLHRLLDQQNEWKWTEAHAKAFTDVKGLLSSDSLLRHFDEKKPIILTCDASPYGIGAVLGHILEDKREAPVAFYSRTMTTTERNYAQIDREALAIVAGIKKFHDFLYGHRFTVITDHKPLLGLFATNKATPQILSPRMLRWSQLLGAYDMELIYRPGSEIGHADGLSRLPLPCKELDIPPLNEVLFMEALPDPPLNASQIAQMTAKDPILSRVLNWVWRGWPSEPLEPEFKPFSARKNELSAHKGCLLWGSRVVIPKKGVQRVLEELHICHPGIVRMKALARSYVWWPGMDDDIGQCVKQCNACQETRHAMPKARVHPWEITRDPWSRIHIDFAGPFQGQTFLIVVDSFSKWLEVVRVQSMTTQAVIQVLRSLFATHGLPDMVVSDNGAQFTSAEFAIFMEKNAIRHTKVAPFHPSSNGQAERMVQTTKDALRRINKGDWNQRLASFLLTQHTTPCTATGLSPAELLMNRRLKTCLDHLHPDFYKAKQQALDENEFNEKPKTRVFVPDQPVYIRNYSFGPRWIPATVTESSGPISYRVISDQGQVVRRHVDQMLDRAEPVEDVQGETTRGEVLSSPSRQGAAEGVNECPSATQKTGVTGTELGSPQIVNSSRPRRQVSRPAYLQDYI